MIRYLAPLLAALAVTGMSVAVPLEPLEAKRFPKRIKTPKKTPEFRQIKAELRTFRATGSRAYDNFKGAFRSERRNRQLFEMAQNNLNSARNAFRADGSPGNQARLVRARQTFQEIDAQYRNALDVYRGAKTEVRRLREIRASNLNAQRQQQGIRPRAPQAGRPRFAQGGRVQQVRVGASVVQNAGSALNGGPSVRYAGQLSPQAQALNQNRYVPISAFGARANPEGGDYFLPGPPPRMYGQDIYANPQAFPTGALAQAAAPGANQSPTAYIPADARLDS
ncbi:MAG: hypothetical protein V2I39_13975 [Erythrobacter sp.]|nr:hypothetical protein [Erythrobacter sp.]